MFYVVSHLSIFVIFPDNYMYVESSYINHVNCNLYFNHLIYKKNIIFLFHCNCILLSCSLACTH